MRKRLGRLITFSGSALLTCLKADWELDMKSELMLSWKQAFLTLRWIHYDVRDERYTPVTAAHISVSLSLSPCSLSRLNAAPLPLGHTPFFNPFRLSQFSRGLSVDASVPFIRTCARVVAYLLRQAPRGAIEWRSRCGKWGHLPVTAAV